LQQRFPRLASKKVLASRDSDYGYRLILAKSVWIKVLLELAKEQEWSNFKNEAARRQGSLGIAYVRSLHQVWEIMYRLQESRVSVVFSK
jgi:hypothetical protein